MRGWNVGDKILDDRGNTGTITGLSTLGAWVSVRGHVNCIGWGGKNGMPDREEYDRRRAERAAGPRDGIEPPTRGFSILTSKVRIRLPGRGLRLIGGTTVTKVSGR